MRYLISLLAALFLFLSLQKTQKDGTPVDIKRPLGFPQIPINHDNKLTQEGILLGKKLFYDKLLSRNKSISCATCHRQEFAFSDGKTKAIGIHQDTLKRNTPGLFNLAWNDLFFWDGRSSSLETQALLPVPNHDEMDLDWKTAEKRLKKHKEYRRLFRRAFGANTIDSTHAAMAIAQFERMLISSNSKFDKVLRGETHLTPSEYNGFVLINDQTKGNCLHCHTTDANALGTTGAMSNNGLQAYTDETDIGLGSITKQQSDYGKFKIPSLRNLLFTAPYMHDGRFSTLEEVIDFYSEEVVFTPQTDSKMTDAKSGGRHLNQQEKKDIVAFLKTLTDSSFISNPAFSDTP